MSQPIHNDPSFANAPSALTEHVLSKRLALVADGTLTGPLLDPLPVDLILMNMQMPQMDGYEAT